MAAAVSAVRNFIEGAPPSSMVAVAAFGADAANQCGSASTIIERAARSTITSAQYQSLESLRPAGSSPIVASVEQAIRSFEGRRGEIVLVSDGTDSCGRNICEISKALEQSPNVSIQLIPIGIDLERFDELGCIFPNSSAQSLAAVPADLHPQQSSVSCVM
jgi:Ca-activated chloride channel family protein